MVFPWFRKGLKAPKIIDVTAILVLLISSFSIGFGQASRPKAYNKLLKLSEELKKQEETLRSEIDGLLKRNPTMRRNSTKGRLTGISPTGRPLYTIDHNSGAAVAARTENLYPGGRLATSLTGAGMIVGIWENGAPIVPHPEFGDRLVILDQADETRGHASHISGTLIASGLNPNARGMAYEATAHVYSADNYLSEITLAAAEGLLVSNHSYGRSAGWSNGAWLGDPQISSTEDWKFGIYNNEAETLDLIAFMAPYYLLARSAGNERGESGDGTFPPDGPFDSITGEAVAKNILTVGNANPLTLQPTFRDQITLSSSSSWGPTDDGRIKPDLTASGVNIFSLSEDEGGYGLKSGTSMSTPVTVGNSILLQQLYERVNGEYMRSATLKGLLMHTTLDAGTAPGPDYSYGYGFLNADLAARTILETSSESLIVEDLLTENETYLATFEVQNTNQPLIISISWTDPPGQGINEAILDPQVLQLINDLDLRVTDPEGNVFFPWILDPSNPGSPAITGDNFRDNYEKIEVGDPMVGTYTIRISHKFNLTNEVQDFTLIASNLGLEDNRDTFYWVGDSGDWSDSSNWSYESGGSSAGQVPTSDHRVVFDPNSFDGSNAVVLDSDVSVRDMIWLAEGDGQIVFGENSITAYRSINLNNSITMNGGSLKLTPGSSNGSIYISNANRTLDIELDGDKDFVLSGEAIIVNDLSLTRGNLQIANDITANRITIASDEPKLVDVADLTVNISELDLGDLSVNSIMADNTIFNFTGENDHLLSSTGDFDFSVVNILNEELQIENSGAIETLTMGAGSGLSLSDEIRIDVDQWSVKADQTERVTIKATSGNATISSNSKSKFCFDFIDISDVSVQGNTKFVYENNSTIQSADGWIEAHCEDVLFAAFDFESPCSQNTTFFTDASDGNPNQWLWDFGDGTTSTRPNPTKTYNSPGFYNVKLTVSENQEISVIDEEISIISSNLGIPVVENLSGRLVTNSPGQLFQWFLDGEILSGETNRLLSIEPEGGNYQVRVSDGTCFALSDPLIITSVDLVETKDKIGVFPNPIHGSIVNLTIPSSDVDTQLEILDTHGKVILNIVPEKLGTTIELDIKELPKGMYIIRIITGEQMINKRFLKVD